MALKEQTEHKALRVQVLKAQQEPKALMEHKA
jgi:hypothetical protein